MASPRDSARPAAAKAAPYPRTIWVLCGLVAILLIGLAGLGLDDFQRRLTVLTQKSENTILTQELESFTKVAGVLQKQAAAQQQRLATLSQSGALADLKIVTLATSSYETVKADAVLVWDARAQQGVLRIMSLPKLAAGQDYQLWITDAKSDHPISGGLVAINNDGETIVSFKPAQPVTAATAFAVNIENAGGAPTPMGPVVLSGK